MQFNETMLMNLHQYVCYESVDWSGATKLNGWKCVYDTC